MGTERTSVDWSDWLELAYNTKVNEAKGLISFMANLGRKAKTPVDRVIRNHQQEYHHPGAAALDWMDRMSKI